MSQTELYDQKSVCEECGIYIELHDLESARDCLRTARRFGLALRKDYFVTLKKTQTQESQS